MMLVVTAYRTSKYILVETQENADCEDTNSQLTITQWAQLYFQKKQMTKGIIQENVNPV